LQIASDRRPRRQDGFRGRQEKKVAATGDQDLWAEEIVLGGQNNRIGEGDVDFNLLARR
jgi:hypothetical protein